MSDDHALELVPLAALGALDGEDARALAESLRGSARCRAEMAAFEAVAARLPLALEPVPPPARVRDAVTTSVALHRAAPARAGPRYLAALAAGAAVALAFGYVRARAERDAAQVDARGAKAGLEALGRDYTAAQVELGRLRKELAREREVRELLARPEARVARLAGLRTAARASARVVWDPGTRQGFLLVSGLAAAPAGKAYELWIVARAAPVPAGVFQVAADGSAQMPLPFVEDAALAKTFAVTLEPEAGTAAPTGPVVLAGAAG